MVWFLPLIIVYVKLSTLHLVWESVDHMVEWLLVQENYEHHWEWTSVLFSDMLLCFESFILKGKVRWENWFSVNIIVFVNLIYIFPLICNHSQRFLYEDNTFFFSLVVLCRNNHCYIKRYCSIFHLWSNINESTWIFRHSKPVRFVTLD